MRYTKTLSKRSKLTLSVAALVLLVGSAIAYADGQKTYSSSYGFQVVDASEPNIVTWVSGSFTGQPLEVSVNMSSQDGVSQLKGTLSVTVQVWNDSSGAFVDFQSLASNVAISLTPAPVTLHYTFTTGNPGDYNILVEFTATSVSTG
ncbi:MAG: hypothetical protein KGI38_11065 [Thaumarchaeota archaeon]|nr:hypothetical protein [Nitrososphaerota archaeon]